MLSFLRKQLSATNLMVIAALVFAMAGGAFAANGGGKGHHAHSAGHHGHHGHAAKKGKKGKKGKNNKNSGKPGPRGKQGPAGPAGATGPAGGAGPAGPIGPAGPAGPAGKNGTNGTNGKDGVSVTSAEFEGEEEPAGEPCEERGGSSFASASGTSYACNGEEGSPWTAGGTLPAGATETGAWRLWNTDPEAGSAAPRPGGTAISFTIPLHEALNAAHVHYINPAGKEVRFPEAGLPVESTSTACTGTVAEPTATPGNLCVYAYKIEGANALLKPNSSGIFPPDAKYNPGYEEGGAGTTGAMLEFTAEAEKAVTGQGTWAVTGA